MTRRMSRQGAVRHTVAGTSLVHPSKQERQNANDYLSTLDFSVLVRTLNTAPMILRDLTRTSSPADREVPLHPVKFGAPSLRSSNQVADLGTTTKTRRQPVLTQHTRIAHPRNQDHQLTELVVTCHRADPEVP